MKTASCKVIELAELGILSWETIAREALQYMSEDDVADMANSCDWLESNGNQEFSGKCSFQVKDTLI